MSEDSEPAELNNGSGPVISHRRLLFKMAIITVAGAVLGTAFISARWGIGILVGGALAGINYWWLRSSLGAMLSKAADGERPSFLAVRYFLRYVLIAAALTVIYLSNALPVVAVILGLASFAFAVVLEGFIQIFSSSFKKEI